MGSHHQDIHSLRRSVEDPFQLLMDTNSHHPVLYSENAEPHIWSRETSSQNHASTTDDAIETTTQMQAHGYHTLYGSDTAPSWSHGAQSLSLPVYAYAILDPNLAVTASLGPSHPVINQSAASFSGPEELSFQEQIELECLEGTWRSQETFDQTQSDPGVLDVLFQPPATQVSAAGDGYVPVGFDQQATPATYLSLDRPQYDTAYIPNVQPTGDVPWSLYSLRQNGQSSQAANPQVIEWQSTGTSVGLYENSVPDGVPTVSQTINDENDQMMGETFNLDESLPDSSQIQRLTEPDATPLMQVSTSPWHRIQFLVTGSTPHQDPSDNDQIQDTTHNLHPNALSVPTDSSSSLEPSSPASSFSLTSAASSPYSVTSPSVPPDLFCDKSGCCSTFSGKYRKGNLARHTRLVHGVLKYPCKGVHCLRSFNRSDARLKHYRTHHPSLAPNPIERRSTQDRARRSVS
ncbi:hypothetical protein C7974DRAFT_62744 [Boeremia exigua]|uniref:uncharacterized protein n=1 Tax=Boeremia exigua TaxID=749465 RepID=UPI001E8D9271|nr:uncharacterized protein C7974DRAFT_62744 [Boeremia exigua]KAH6615301.1 hypothetical protein C7974DRAFT_62744 [Boeremia exigua]